MKNLGEGSILLHDDSSASGILISFGERLTSEDFWVLEEISVKRVQSAEREEAMFKIFNDEEAEGKITEILKQVFRYAGQEENIPRTLEAIKLLCEVHLIPLGRAQTVEAG